MTCEQIALQHGLCTCDPIYTSRGMKAPDCPWHTYEVESAMEAYGRQEAKAEAVDFCHWAGLNGYKFYNQAWYKNGRNDRKVASTSDLYDLYLTYKNKNHG